MRRGVKVFAALSLVGLVLVAGRPATIALGEFWVHQKISRLAGAGAVACGEAAWRDAVAQERVKDCVTAQMASGTTPFWAGFKAPGIDSNVARFISRDKDGRFQATSYDSSPTGVCFVFCIWSTRTEKCPAPALRRVTVEGHPNDWTWIALDCKL